MICSVNPYTNEIIEEFQSFDSILIKNTIDACFNTFLKWKITSLSHRINTVISLRNILIKNKNKAATMITIEIGKPIKESNAEIDKCIWLCDYFIENAPHFLKNKKIDIGSQKSFIKYDPIGIVLGIMPWNFPFWQVFRYVVPTLLVGNGVLLKHAPNATMCAKLIQAFFDESGFPENILSLLIIDEKQVESVVQDKKIQAVTLTGSTKAGSSVASISGKYIKKKLFLNWEGQTPLLF